MMTVLVVIAVLLFIIAMKIAPEWMWLFIAVLLCIPLIQWWWVPLWLLVLLVEGVVNAWPFILSFLIVGAIVTALMVAHDRFWVPFREHHGTFGKRIDWLERNSHHVIGGLLIGVPLMAVIGVAFIALSS